MGGVKRLFWHDVAGSEAQVSRWGICPTEKHCCITCFTRPNLCFQPSIWSPIAMSTRQKTSYYWSYHSYFYKYLLRKKRKSRRLNPIFWCWVNWVGTIFQAGKHWFENNVDQVDFHHNSQCAGFTFSMWWISLWKANVTYWPQHCLVWLSKITRFHFKSEMIMNKMHVLHTLNTFYMCDTSSSSSEHKGN